MSILSRWSRRRFVTVAVTIALLISGTVALTAAGSHDPARYLPPPDQRVAPPGERLVPLVLLKAVAAEPDDKPDRPEMPIFEVLPDGTVAEVFRWRPDDLLIGGVRPRSDGRLVALGSRDPMPGVARRDGPLVEGVQYPLLVIGADGTVESDRDVRIVGQYVNLVGITATEVILQRSPPDPPDPARLVARNPSTGAERDLGTNGTPASRGDVAGDRVVLAGGGINGDDVEVMDNTTQCWVELFVLGAGVTKRVSIPACHQAVEVNASPDGRFAAVVYQRWGGPDELRLLTVELDHMRVATDELLGNPVDCTACVTANAGYLGMAWNDNRMLRVVFMDPLPIDTEPDDVLGAIENRLRTQTRTMIG